MSLRFLTFYFLFLSLLPTQLILAIHLLFFLLLNNMITSCICQSTFWGSVLPVFYAVCYQGRWKAWFICRCKFSTNPTVLLSSPLSHTLSITTISITIFILSYFYFMIFKYHFSSLLFFFQLVILCFVCLCIEIYPQSRLFSE